MKIIIPLLLVVAFTGGSLSAQRGHPKLSPFDGIRWNGDRPEVQLDKTWYALLSIDGLTTEKILASCEKRWGKSNIEERFREDLCEAAARVGTKLGVTVTLKLKDLKSGETTTKKKVPNTRRKRERLRIDARRAGFAPRESKRLSSEAARADLASLAKHIEELYAYRDLKGHDWKSAFDKRSEAVTATMAPGELGVEIMKLLAPFGDGHTRLAGSMRSLPRGYLPFRLVDFEGRILALAPESHEPFDKKFPFLTHIEDLPIESWIQAAGVIAPQGAPHFHRRSAIERLHWIEFARSEKGIENSKLTYRLSNDGDKARRDVTLEPASRFPAPPRTLRPAQKILEGNVGYLFIPSMASGDSFVTWLRTGMASLAKTDGLIIDVRNNGGGSRTALRTLLPYFLDPKAGPRVVNVAAYRLPPGTRGQSAEGYLDNRFLWPAKWKGWSKAERAAIEKCQETFQPDWTLPKGDFSPWHFMVVRPVSGTDTGFRYRKPVIILQDGGCFSATDIFLGAFAGLDGVTLMGTTSGGGSGRSQKQTLPKSGLQVRLSSMASFRPDGRRYDGLGIQPDVEAKPTFEDLLKRSDSVLEAARRRLAK